MSHIIEQPKPCQRLRITPRLSGTSHALWAYHDGVDLGGPALARIEFALQGDPGYYDPGAEPSHSM
jgi:hypothetical protein